MGSRQSITPQQRLEVEESLRFAGSVKAVARKTGLSLSSVYNIRRTMRSESSPAFEEHRQGIEARALSVTESLASFPPTPGRLLSTDRWGNTHRWKAQAAISTVQGDADGFTALVQHLRPLKFESSWDSFCRGLKDYQEEAGELEAGVQEKVNGLGIESLSQGAVVGLFRIAADQACFDSESYGGDTDDAMGEFPYFWERPRAVSEDGATIIYQIGRLKGAQPVERPTSAFTLWIGEHQAGRAHGDQQAREAVKKLGDAAEALIADNTGDEVADRYFDLLKGRDRLSQLLGPFKVKKWAADGRCELCPSS